LAVFKMPKQAYIAEFKELAVKRVKSRETERALAPDLGLVEQTLRNRVKAAKAGKLQGRPGPQGGQGRGAGPTDRPSGNIALSGTTVLRRDGRRRRSRRR
jgi:hypothetical protein